MINIRPLIQQRIRSQVAAFKEVAGASDLASILAGRLADPGAYVFQQQQRAGDNESAVGLIQAVTQQIAVIIVVKNVKDSRGGDAADTSFVLQTAVQAALLNWQPHADFAALTYAGGALVSFVGGFHVWKDTFTTPTYLQY